MSVRTQEAQELRRQIEWTLARAVDPSDVLPMLHRLARLANDGSDENLFAHLHLAELLVERDPCARRSTPSACSPIGPTTTAAGPPSLFAQTLLGNYRFAVSAYHHALTSAPKNPWYSAQPRHLLDVARWARPRRGGMAQARLPERGVQRRGGGQLRARAGARGTYRRSAKGTRARHEARGVARAHGDAQVAGAGGAGRQGPPLAAPCLRSLAERARPRPGGAR